MATLRPTEIVVNAFTVDCSRITKVTPNRDEGDNVTSVTFNFDGGDSAQTFSPQNAERVISKMREIGNDGILDDAKAKGAQGREQDDGKD